MSNPAIKPPTAPCVSSLGEFMSSAQAIIMPDRTPTKPNMTHVSKTETSIYYYVASYNEPNSSMRRHYVSGPVKVAVILRESTLGTMTPMSNAARIPPAVP